MNVPLSWRHFFDLIGITAFVYLISDLYHYQEQVEVVKVRFIFYFVYFLKGATSATLLVWRFATYYAGLILGGLTMSFSRELNFATKNDKKEITENDQTIVIEDIEEIEFDDFKK